MSIYLKKNILKIKLQNYVQYITNNIYIRICQNKITPLTWISVLI
jgi:hypothetical protein